LLFKDSSPLPNIKAGGQGTRSGLKAAYGYSAYGGSNLSLTKTAAGFSPNLNAYRFQSERFDTGSNTLDFGARRYSPSIQRFVQRDSFLGALDDLGLSTNPLAGNRYVFTAANPINFVDLDGHTPKQVGGLPRSVGESPRSMRIKSATQARGTRNADEYQRSHRRQNELGYRRQLDRASNEQAL